MSTMSDMPETNMPEIQMPEIQMPEIHMSEIQHTPSTFILETRSDSTSPLTDQVSADERCLICNNTYADSSGSPDGAAPSTLENINILRILCQLMRVSWDTFTNYVPKQLPFCSECSTGVMGLIQLRERLLKLESEMSHCIRQLESRVASTNSSHKDMLDFDSIRFSFRKQVLEEYNVRELLRQKIGELTANVVCKLEPPEPEESHVIEVEPSFVQLHLGMRIRAAEERQYQSTNKIEVNVDLERVPGEGGDLDDTAEWINNQDRPLTRLRLASASTRLKLKRERNQNESKPLKNFISRDSSNSNSSLHANANEDEEDAEFTEKNHAFAESQGDDNENSNSDLDLDNYQDDDSDFEIYDEPKPRRRKRNAVSTCKMNLRERTSTRLSKKNLRNRRRFRQWPPETYAEIEVREDGRKFFEGIEIHWREGDETRGEFVLKCGSCDKEIDKNNALSQQRCAYRLMQTHIKAYHLDAYKCKECGKSLHNHRRLIFHLETQHPPGGKKVKPRQSRVFGTQKMPQEIFVGDDGTLTYQEIPFVRTELEAEDFHLLCGMCPKSFTNLQSRRSKQCPYRQMINHIRAKHLLCYSCDQCGKAYRCQKELQHHIDKTHAENPLELRCDICGKPISEEAYLRKHMWTHKNAEEREIAIAAGETGPRTYKDIMEKRKALGIGATYQCSECGKTFNFGSSLRRHEYVHKKDIREHKCQHCGKLFNTAENLKGHIKYIHETERVHKKYRCSYCPKWFVTKSPWEKHERTHTKHIPFYCPMCNKGFALKQSMVTHVRNKKCTGGVDQHPQSMKLVKPRKQALPKPSTMNFVQDQDHLSEDAKNTSPALPVQNQYQQLLTVGHTVNLEALQPMQIDMPVPAPAHRNNVSAGAAAIAVPFPFPSYARHFNQNCPPQPHYNAYI